VVLGDEVLLHTLLVNLLENAIKASHPGGRVVLSGVAKEDAVTITVRDDGQGMAEEHVERVFEPFYRTDQARSSKQGGTGLGLALCRQIAEAHGAVIRIESELGHGTTVTVAGLRL